MFKVLMAGVLLAGICMPALAGYVNLGSIGVWPGAGASDGYSLIVLSNQSGLGPCGTADGDSGALSCDAVTLTDWSLEVDYTSLMGGSQLQQVADYNSSAACVVTGCVTFIESGNDFTGNPLYTLPYSDARVTRIVFKASLPGSIFIWNPLDTAQSSFFPQSPFTFTLNIPQDSAYALGNDTSFLTPLSISDAPGAGTIPDVPEPATLMLAFGGLLATMAHRYRNKDRHKA